MHCIHVWPLKSIVKQLHCFRRLSVCSLSYFKILFRKRMPKQTGFQRKLEKILKSLLKIPKKLLFFYSSTPIALLVKPTISVQDKVLLKSAEVKNLVHQAVYLGIKRISWWLCLFLIYALTTDKPKGISKLPSKKSNNH